MDGSRVSVLPGVREEKGAVRDNWGMGFDTENTECTEKNKRRAEARLYAEWFVGGLGDW
jgi:hypothetical protein